MMLGPPIDVGEIIHQLMVLGPRNTGVEELVEVSCPVELKEKNMQLAHLFIPNFCS